MWEIWAIFGYPEKLNTRSPRICGKVSDHCLICWIRVFQCSIQWVTIAESASKHSSLKGEFCVISVTFFVRIAKDTKVLDMAKYAKTQQQIDEIGRMLGGWIKHFKGEKEESESAPL